MPHDDADFVHAAPQQLVDDAADDRGSGEGQELLARADPARKAGGGHHGDDHGGTGHAGGPFRRTAISSATMLTAISGTVTAPISRPIGARTRSNSSAVAIPFSRKFLRTKATLRRLPIMPRYASGRWMHLARACESWRWPRVTRHDKAVRVQGTSRDLLHDRATPHADLGREARGVGIFGPIVDQRDVKADAGRLQRDRAADVPAAGNHQERRQNDRLDKDLLGRFRGCRFADEPLRRAAFKARSNRIAAWERRCSTASRRRQPLDINFNVWCNANGRNQTAPPPLNQSTRRLGKAFAMPHDRGIDEDPHRAAANRGVHGRVQVGHFAVEDMRLSCSTCFAGQSNRLGLDHASANRAPKPAGGVDNHARAAHWGVEPCAETTRATAIGAPRSISSTMVS